MPQPLAVWLLMFALDLGRYVLFAGAAFAIFWVWGRERFRARLIQGEYPSRAKLLHDVRWSLSTALVFSVMGLGVHYGGRCGVLRRYETIGERGVLWLVVSVVLLIVLQDAFFYWAHRAMHHPRLYRVFHRVHHASRNPSPLTAYAFAPLEALAHALFVPLAWLVLPLHEAAVFAFLAFMIARNVLGHLSMELYPSGFTRSAFWGQHTTTTHHALHHLRPGTNFGLYFTFWDRLMGTEDPRYHEAFERAARTPEPTEDC